MPRRKSLSSQCILHALFSNLCLKKQSSIDLFVFNCMCNSSQDLISGVNPKGSNDTSWPTCSDRFWFYTNYMTLPGRCAGYSLLESHNSTGLIWLVQLVTGYLNNSLESFHRVSMHITAESSCITNTLLLNKDKMLLACWPFHPWEVHILLPQ